jgi:molybdopterin-binding protein
VERRFDRSTDIAKFLKLPIERRRRQFFCAGRCSNCAPNSDSPDRAILFALMRISARNRLVGKITEINLGDIMAHVVVKVGEHEVESIITRRSAEELKLKVGDTVGAIIKSTEVMIQKA